MTVACTPSFAVFRGHQLCNNIVTLGWEFAAHSDQPNQKLIANAYA
jgi:hypothetical protein